MTPRKPKWVPIEGYVYCMARGEVHDDTTPLGVASHQSTGDEFWDIYQDGQLCNPKIDHVQLAALFPIGYEQ